MRARIDVLPPRSTDTISALDDQQSSMPLRRNATAAARPPKPAPMIHRGDRRRVSDRTRPARYRRPEITGVHLCGPQVRPATPVPSTLRDVGVFRRAAEEEAALTCCRVRLAFRL